MIILTEDIKNVCNKILFALDGSNISQITEALEMQTQDNYLYLNVTNKEYYVRTKLNVYDKYDFHATVQASTFLKLVSKTSANSIELTCDNNCLIFKGDGKYKLPMIYDNEGNLLTLPTIKMDQENSAFDISKDIISNIYKFNSKQLRKQYKDTVQDMYYIDESGCITFTTGACVNSFTLPSTCKLLLTDKIVKLFKLFTDENIKFRLGHSDINGIIQTIVEFSDSNVNLTAILLDNNLINSVPQAIIRKRASKTYPYNIIVNKNEFVRAIDRLMIFDPLCVGYFEFNKDAMSISNKIVTNVENISYINKEESIENSYKAQLDLNDLKVVLDTFSDEYINIGFGDSQAFVITKENIVNIIPEVVD